MPRDLGAIIVGAGLMGRWHADAVARCGGRVVCVVDPDGSRAARLAARHRGAIVRAELAAALESAGGEVVHLCAPTATHEAYASAAAAAGRHLLVEKPVAPTLAATRRLLDLAASRGVLLCPVHQFLFQPGLLRVCRLMDSLGRIRHVDFETASAGGASGSDAERDAIAMDILPHPFALIERLLPNRFRPGDWQVAHPCRGELRLCAEADGVTAGVLVSMHGRPTMNQLRVIAERGTVRADLFGGFAVVEPPRASGLNKIAKPFLLSVSTLAAAAWQVSKRTARFEFAYPGLRELVRRFYIAVGSGGANPIAPDETLAVAAAYEQIVTAIERTRRG